MKIIKLNGLFLVLAASFASCQDRSDLKLNIVTKDEKSKPLEDVKIETNVFEKWQPGEGFGNDIYKYVTFKTDSTGLAVFEASTSRCDLVFTAYKEGYYSTDAVFNSSNKSAGRWQPWNSTLELKLKPKLNPIPLIAKKVVKGVAGYVPLPAFGKPVGYDLEVGDWTVPYGSGTKPDIFFQLDGQRTDLSVLFEVSLRVTFNNPRDGFVVQKRDTSGLRVPYLAPQDGYREELFKKKALVAGDPRVLKGRPKRVDDNVNENYFLRLRTVVDENGNITSANYAKIYGGFKWTESGSIQFQYYFNPVLNDRNLEFDPARNILHLSKNEQVQEP